MSAKQEHQDRGQSHIDKTIDKADKKVIRARAKEIKKTLIKEAKLREKEAASARKVELHALRENWYKLDNSALIYPAIGSSEWNSVFRLTVEMHEPVDPVILQQALDDVMQRYPFFNVALCDGLFWHYFQSLTTKPVVQLETDYPCRAFKFDKTRQIFRVLYYNNTISYETFHSLTDGGGAMQFFNTLVVRYCQLRGVDIAHMQQYNLNALDLPNPEENEDAFERFADGGKPRSRKEAKAYEIGGALEPIQKLMVYTGIVDMAALKAKSKEYNATVNQFLSAVYMKVMIDEKRRTSRHSKRPVKLSIPINLRKMFPSRTMRNFSQFINITIPVDKETESLEHLVEIVKQETSALNQEYVMGVINANVSSERNFFVRIMPLFIKDFVLNIVYSFVGERLFTSTLTNLGIATLPPEVEQCVQSYRVMLGATKLNKLNLAVVSCAGKTALTMSTRLKDNRVITAFFAKLAELGLDITIDSNKEG